LLMRCPPLSLTPTTFMCFLLLSMEQILSILWGLAPASFQSSLCLL
jgi:hypothetical protein